MKQKWIQKAQSAVKPITPNAIVEIVARKMETIALCKERLDKEGHVVRDLKGNVVPHPAIQIIDSTEKQLLEILRTYGAKPQ